MRQLGENELEQRGLHGFLLSLLLLLLLLLFSLLLLLLLLRRLCCAVQGGSARLPPSTQDDDGRLKSMKKIRSGLAVSVFLNPNKARGCSII